MLSLSPHMFTICELYMFTIALFAISKNVEANYVYTDVWMDKKNTKHILPIYILYIYLHSALK